MTAAQSPAPAPAGAVTRHWATGLIITSLDIDGITVPAAPADGPACQELPCDPASLATLEQQFLASMNTLAGDAGAAPVTRVTVTVRHWRAGYDEPAFAVPARYAAWTILDASPGPEHEESGCLAFSDPRAGSPMTAVPGLPFGRQAVVRPVRGAHAAVPGWLTSSVIPLEGGQHVTVAAAAAAAA